MNVRTDFHVYLRVQSSTDTEAFRDELLLVLLDYGIEAIHDADDGGLCWDVSFGERTWDRLGIDVWLVPHSASEPVDSSRWRTYPDLEELETARAGKRLMEKFGALLRCELRAGTSGGSGSVEGLYDRVQIGRVIVSPPWQFPEIDDATILLKIEPSTGFGTGQHPTTRLALLLLQYSHCDGRDVLDVGTGSGIRRNALSQRIELGHADILRDSFGAVGISGSGAGYRHAHISGARTHRVRGRVGRCDHRSSV